ncbi:MAG: Fe-S-binding domain-containing protein, partial [Candidatus Dadabacteria bacterium]|nr:Fe-S-binding domain-containing protein [Candidatus Dadabacteria bacterium]
MDSILAGNLSLIVFFPLIGALFLVLLSLAKKDYVNDLKIAALIISLIEFALSLPLFFNFQKGIASMQFEQKVPWLSEFGINYHLGIDGISVFLVLLTTFIMPVTILSAWNAIQKGVREFLVLMFVLETA